MSSRTINYGIDLGMTEATIARLDGTSIEVFRNAEGFESTPCAVWIDKQGRVVTGRVAKEWCERDSENAYCEFKRDMGSRREYLFARSGRKMKPEELSAEILKSLRADVHRRLGEEIFAAVITVPAEFNLTACEATQTSARLAGFQHSFLLNEPIAAASAYNINQINDETHWLVYSLQSGSFDVSVLRVRDGLFQLVALGGDCYLGDRSIDWAIVEQLFVPTLLKERQLTDFKRSNPKWQGAWVKLKMQAECAKLQLSTMESVEVQIDFLCNDDRGEPVEFYYTLHRSELEKLTAPFIRRTVTICKEILSGRRLSPSAISKVILVGGTTLMPVVRAHLSSPNEGLGIPLEFNVDPLTVVARGAAVFAGGQSLPAGSNSQKGATGQIKPSSQLLYPSEFRIPPSNAPVVPTSGFKDPYEIFKEVFGKDPNEFIEMQSLVMEAGKLVAEIRKIVEGNSGIISNINQRFGVLDREISEAIKYAKSDLLAQKLRELRALASDIGGHRLAITARKIGSNGTAEIKGTISGPVGLLPRGFCLELVNEDVRPEWRSGWLPLDPTGDFCVMASVHSEATTNEFSVALRDSAGKPKKLLPNYFVTRA